MVLQAKATRNQRHEIANCVGGTVDDDDDNEDEETSKSD
jgi:hypothetical protein